MSKRTLYLIGACCALTTCLSAGPILTLTATAATAVADQGPVCVGPNPINCQAGIAASAPPFTLLGSGPNPGLTFNEGGTFASGFHQTLPAFIPGTIQPGSGKISGVSLPALYYGSFTVTGPELQATILNPPLDTLIQITYGSTHVTTSPTATLVLPAILQGSFAACTTTGLPPPSCDSSSPNFVADISIDLPGELTWSVNVNPIDGVVTLNDSFTSAPEPASLLLLAVGVALASAIRRRCRNF